MLIKIVLLDYKWSEVEKAVKKARAGRHLAQMEYRIWSTREHQGLPTISGGS